MRSAFAALLLLAGFCAPVSAAPETSPAPSAEGAQTLASPAPSLVPAAGIEPVLQENPSKEAQSEMQSEEAPEPEADPQASAESADGAAGSPAASEQSEANAASEAEEAAQAAERAAAELIAEHPAEIKSDPLLDDALLAPDPGPLDDIFLEAKKNFDRSRLDALEKLRPQLEKHELAAYPELWSLILRLKAKPDDPETDLAFRRFIEREDGNYLAERARTDYIRIKGGDLSADGFRKIFSRLAWNQTDDPVAAAWNAYYTLETALAGSDAAAKTRALNAAKAFYRDTGSNDDAVRTLGDLIAAADPSWQWTRVVVLLQKRKLTETKRVLRTLPKSEMPASLQVMNRIIDQPRSWLRAQKNLSKIPARLAVFAALRMAPTRPEDAARIAQAAIDPKAAAFWKSLVWSRIGFTASSRLDPRASGWYKRAGNALNASPYAVVDAGQLMAWHARAALRDGSWSTVRKVIDAMPKRLRDEEVWIYWRARALAAQGKKAEAQAAYARIAHRITFYGKLAADALGRPYGFDNPPKAMPAQDGISAWSKNLGIQRAQSFYRMSLYREGHREWNWAMRGLDPMGYVTLASYAHQAKLVHRMINTSQKSGDDIVVIAQRFPRPQLSLVSLTSKAQGLPPAWVYGLIRQESRFMPAVRSSVGARGLMQIMPATAKWMARHLAIDGFDLKKLTDLEMNLLLGTAYLHMLYSDFDQSFVLATAAYNAGPARSRQWRAAVKRPMEAAVFIETIPFFETREYVKNVLANMHTYAMLDGAPDQRFIEMIGSVKPGQFKASDLP